METTRSAALGCRVSTQQAGTKQRHEDMRQVTQRTEYLVALCFGPGSTVLGTSLGAGDDRFD